MSLLFGDVYEGIRAIRITKGVAEKDILNYVQDRVGGCMKVGNVLKTIKTIKELCDEGILVKNAGRYLFATTKKIKDPCDPESDEGEGEEEEDEGCGQPLDMPDDECDESDKRDEKPEGGEGEGGEEPPPEGSQEGGEEPAPEGGENEEEEEEDDEDDEEDEDEDEDDDDECDEEAMQASNGDMKKDDCEKSKEDFLSTQSGRRPTACGKSVDDGNAKNMNAMDGKASQSLHPEGRRAGRSGKRNCKGKPVMERDGGDASNHGSEAIAFCVRDFIDSLGGPDSESKGHELTHTSEDMSEENMDSVKTFDLAKQFPKKRGLRKKKNVRRDKSPMKAMQAELYHCGEIGPVCSDVFVEPADDDMEIEPDVSGDVDRVEPRNDIDKKVPEVITLGNSFDDFRGNVLRKNSQMLQLHTKECNMDQMTWYPLEERESDEQKTKRSTSDEEDEMEKEKTASLCSVCEKKKRSS